MSKQRPILFSTPMVQAILDGRKTQTRRIVKPQPPYDEHEVITCPYGHAGDVLWVRETWQPSSSVAYVHFKADCRDGDPGKGWKPSIHMPKDACRLFLLITSVRLERLQSITRQDAAAEGVCIENEAERFPGYQIHRWPEENFQTLWENINGEQSWRDNPWVWVIEFQKMEGRP